MLDFAGSQNLGQTNFPALAAAKGKRKGKSQGEPRTTEDVILDTNNSALEMIPANGSETVV